MCIYYLFNLLNECTNILKLNQYPRDRHVFLFVSSDKNSVQVQCMLAYSIFCTYICVKPICCKVALKSHQLWLHHNSHHGRG